MLIDWMFDSTIDFIQGEPASDYGTATVMAWSRPRLVATVRASVQPIHADEVLTDRNAIVTRWQAWIPVTEGLSELMRVRHRGIAYEIEGSIQQWPDPVGVGLDHMTFYLRRADG